MMNKHINLVVVLILVIISFSIATMYQISEIDAAGLDDFVITVKTDNAGTSGDNEFTIPTTGGGYNYDVDWGDTNTDVGITGNITHTYDSPGTYQIRISGDFPRIYFNNEGDRLKLLSVDQWGTGIWTSMNSAFYGAENMNVLAVDAPNLSQVTSLQQMFRGATSLNADFDDWEVLNVLDMSSMFSGATNFNGDISGWDVSNVEDFSVMFFLAENFNSDISGWNTSGATGSMVSMFKGASAFNQDIGSWEVSGVTNMAEMFQGATSFNQDIGSWEVLNVTDMSKMFRLASSFNQDLNDWEVLNVLDMSSMFSGATNFNGDISGWDVSNVEDFSVMFLQAENFNSDISGWNTSGATGSMVSMFKGATSFNQDIGSWEVSGVTNMAEMFQGATSFNQDIGSWEVLNVTDMSKMFRLASSFNQDLSDWEVLNVLDMSSMFSLATNFNSDISGWDVSNVANMSDMLVGTSFSTKNYDVLLIEWSGLTLQNGVSFGATGVNYCHGEDARAEIVNDYSWNFSGDSLDCTDANKFPTDILVDGEEFGEVLENQASGTRVGLLTVEDEDLGDTHTYAETCSMAGADNDKFMLDGSNVLWTGEEFDFENPSDADEDNVYELCFVVTDDGKPNLTSELNITIEVQNVNEAPVSLTLRDGTNITDFKERRDIGSVIESLVTDDNGEENPNGFVYSLACENDGPDDEYFATSGSNLISDFQFYASTPRDVNKDNIYEICVRTTDEGGLSLDANFVVEILSIGTQGGSASAGGGGSETTEVPNVEDDAEEETTNDEEVFENTELVKEADTEDSSETPSETQTEEGEEFYEDIYEEAVVEDSPSSSGGGGGGSNNLDVLDFDIETTNVTRGEFMKLILDVYYEKTGETLDRSGTEPFPDVDPSYGNYWYVVEAYEMGVIRGDMGYAYVNRELNRVEALAMVLRVVGIDYEDYRYTLAYSDVDPSKWYASVIEAAREEGLVMWGEGNTFRPGMTLVDTEVERLLEETMSRLD